MMQTKAKYLSLGLVAALVAGEPAVNLADKLLSDVEGESSLTVYMDGSGVWTNCRGNTHGVDPARVMTREECDAIDKRNLEHYVRYVNTVVKTEVPESTKAAMASFAYNVGERAFFRSTLLRKVNAGDIEGACLEFQRWVFDGGRDCRLTRGMANGCYGQVHRRNKETELCSWDL